MGSGHMKRPPHPRGQTDRPKRLKILPPHKLRKTTKNYEREQIAKRGVV